jgi:hypothetical protein
VHSIKFRNLMTALIVAVFFLTSAAGAMADRERDQKQAQLDAACEQAREKILGPQRAGMIETCVANKEQPNRNACEVFYADYGAQSGRRAPLYYDLPECVEAFEYQNSQRQR